jgi:hypothetical protein
LYFSRHFLYIIEVSPKEAKMKKWLILIPVLVMGLSVLACGSISPPETCGDEIGGVADETLFGEYFESMELVNANTWQPGAQGENGMEFAEGEALLIMFDARTEVQVRACIQHTVGGGEIAFDDSVSFQAGSNEFQIGSFVPGPYVIRIIVGNTLVKNFQFVINE